MGCMLWEESPEAGLGWFRVLLPVFVLSFGCGSDTFELDVAKEDGAAGTPAGSDPMGTTGGAVTTPPPFASNGGLIDNAAVGGRAETGGASSTGGLTSDAGGQPAAAQCPGAHPMEGGACALDAALACWYAGGMVRCVCDDALWSCADIGLPGGTGPTGGVGTGGMDAGGGASGCPPVVPVAGEACATAVTSVCSYNGGTFTCICADSWNCIDTTGAGGWVPITGGAANQAGAATAGAATAGAATAGAGTAGAGTAECPTTTPGDGTECVVPGKVCDVAGTVCVCSTAGWLCGW